MILTALEFWGTLLAVRNFTKHDNWSVQRLVAAVEGQDGAAKVEIPRFQRSIVWPLEKRRSLIESIFRGFPIGSLLVHEESQAGPGPSTYRLVDGLQRTTSIMKYAQEPLTYVPAKEAVTPDSMSSLQRALSLVAGSELTDDAIWKALGNWMVATGTVQPTDGFDWHGLSRYLVTEYGDGHAEEHVSIATLEEAAKAVVNDIQKAVSIDAVEIPVIIFKGSTGDLPEIFELINTSGTKLSKYEVYAAAWVHERVRIGNAKIRDAILAKYQELREQGYDLSDLPPDSEIGEDEFTLFEYLFGLGRLLADEYPRLFSEVSDPTETNTVAFAIATVAHGLKIADMGKLPSVLERDKDKIIIVDEFESAVMDACTAVDKCLMPYIGLRLNQRSNKRFLAHSQNQIASMIVRYMLAVRSSPRWTARDNKDEASSLTGRLPAYYLYDILRQAWRGSGDSRLFDIVWSQPDDNGDRRPSSHYLTQISENAWHDVFNVWSADQLQKQQSSRWSVRDVEKIFLKYLYAGVVTHLSEHQDRFDIEHLFPVSRLAQIIKARGDDGWPISAVGNLALFEESLNREKSQKTIAEYLDGLSEEERAIQRPEIAKYVVFPEPEDVSIPRGPEGDDLFEEFDRDTYVAVIHSRFEALVEKVLAGLPK